VKPPTGGLQDGELQQRVTQRAALLEALYPALCRHSAHPVEDAHG